MRGPKPDCVFAFYHVMEKNIHVVYNLRNKTFTQNPILFGKL